MSSFAASKRLFNVAEYLLIIISASIPLFSSFPYRINIFLSWEGAYRLSIGQLPYKDFGMPLGYGYWLIPALFFKIFGPAMITLVKAQVCINIISGISFLSILKSLRINPAIRFASLLVYILSYSFINFWPWYNHTVIVYEFIGLAFLFKYLMPTLENKASITWLIPAGFFIFLSFFTKQDGGGLGLMLASALLLYYAVINKKFIPLIIFIGAFLLSGVILIAPFVQYNFGYWFNHGQPPHNSRMSLSDLISDLFGNSQWLKFYALLFVILLLPFIKTWKQFWNNQRLMLLTLLVSGIWVEALIFQFTSYIPPNNNIFFQSFCFMFVITLLCEHNIVSFINYKHVTILCLLVLFWWSEVYWKYIDRLQSRFLQTNAQAASPSSENVISRSTYTINTDTSLNIPESEWVFSKYPVFKKIYMPPSTVEGIDSLVNNPVVKAKGKDLKMLNMTELTPINYILGVTPEHGTSEPLWYHLGVGMFNKQRDMYCDRIKNNYYDVVLYEYIPTLNNFFPFQVQQCLRENYQLVNSFLGAKATNKFNNRSVYEKAVKKFWLQAAGFHSIFRCVTHFYILLRNELTSRFEKLLAFLMQDPQRTER